VTEQTMTTDAQGEAATAGSTSRTRSLFFIGNATMLLRLGPFTVLTDPNFLHKGDRAYLGHGLTSKRLQDPAIGVQELPELDLVVLSHMHGDHWDRVIRKHLDPETPIVTTPHAARRLKTREGFKRALALATWETDAFGKDGHTLRVTAMPGRHAPLPVKRLLPPVMGSLLELGDAAGRPLHRIYITGDTLRVPELDEIPRRHPDIDTCVVHLGGTKLPGGLMVTMDGNQGADVVELIRPGQAVPIHYEEYTVMKSPLVDFRAEVDRRGLTDKVSYVTRGDTLEL
jgi:L-ascorbate metabolism protein UlaG (beta-lactamase superfamily)